MHIESHARNRNRALGSLRKPPRRRSTHLARFISIDFRGEKKKGPRGEPARKAAAGPIVMRALVIHYSWKSDELEYTKQRLWLLWRIGPTFTIERRGAVAESKAQRVRAYRRVKSFFVRVIKDASIKERCQRTSQSRSRLYTRYASTAADAPCVGIRARSLDTLKIYISRATVWIHAHNRWQPPVRIPSKSAKFASIRFDVLKKIPPIASDPARDAKWR
ncbi:unnamed protein product [Trichogramma brassicae]|uniref:Uncharacterized protein n=1 Tax=Trichogramma brassicae TaxID=86971 RepID=A0A6H5IDP8_9HYME|nr:unnamed protein product [Trichogramma brassicae]